MAFDSFRDFVIVCSLHQRAVIRTESFTKRVKAKGG
jgi:hypothetical protein